VVDGDIDPDNGIYDAMNKGIARANGDFVMFMNAGDVFAGENTLSKIAQYDADFIYGDAMEGGHLKRAKHHSKIKSGMVTHHQSMVYRTKILKTLQFDERYRVAADYKLTLQFINLSNSIEYINSVLSIFDVGGVSQQNARLGRIEESQIRKDLGIRSTITPYRQWGTQILKNYAPWLYWALKN